jgi:hypothetical protein
MAAVPFGFSFGDFVAAIDVIHKVVQALKKSSGARSHFHQTVADLEGFETVLRRVEALCPTIVPQALTPSKRYGFAHSNVIRH